MGVYLTFTDKMQKTLKIFTLMDNGVTFNVKHKLFITDKTKDWCKLPYPNHPKGCPNYNNSEQCPPKVKMINEYFDLDRPHWFIINKFDILSFSNRMKEKHPNWSDKKSRCCLYWQNSVRKKLKGLCEQMKEINPEMEYTLIPEAMGVNVIKTAKRIGIPIKVRPKNYIIKIAFIGYPSGHNKG